jgi:hypothetical protein
MTPRSMAAQGARPGAGLPEGLGPDDQRVAFAAEAVYDGYEGLHIRYTLTALELGT